MYTEKIKKIIEGIKPGVDTDKNLIDDGVLTSIDIVSLVAELSDEFDVEITVVDVVPENFNSVEAIAAMIERLEDE